MILRSRFIALALLSSLVLSGNGAVAQNGEATQIKLKSGKTPPSLPVLYRFFLSYQLHLDRKADALKQKGKDGEDLRFHYQMRLGFSDQEAAKLHESALHLEKVLREKDDEAQKIIKEARSAIPKGPLPTGWIIPPPPPRLKALQAERDAAVNSEITTLRQKLTPEDVVKIETFLQKDFAPAVTVETLPNHIPQPSVLSRRAK